MQCLTNLNSQNIYALYINFFNFLSPPKEKTIYVWVYIFIFCYIIKNYFMQLECCGIEGPKDWDMNVYFNCSSIDVGSREACGVPFSCCKPQPNVRIFLIIYLYRSSGPPPCLLFIFYLPIILCKSCLHINPGD